MQCAGNFSVNLSTKMTVSQAFQCIVRHCAAHINANDAGLSVAATWNAESLHQMRVGIRRLRAALAIFHRVQPFPHGLKKEIEWLDQQLSAARDWDVLSETTLPDMVRFLHKTGINTNHLTPLLQAVSKRAQSEHVLASAILSAARYSRLMLQLNHWKAGRITPDPKNKTRSDKKISLKKFSRDAIQKSQRHLVKCNKKGMTIDPKSLHRFRIAIKKCHYTIDFFKSLYPEKKMQKYMRKITVLQDMLGAHNDVVVADRLLNELAINYADLAESASFACGFLAARIKPKELHNHSSWKKLFNVLSDKSLVKE